MKFRLSVPNPPLKTASGNLENSDIQSKIHSLELEYPEKGHLFYKKTSCEISDKSGFNVIIGPALQRSHIFYDKLSEIFSRAGGTTYCLNWYGQGYVANNDKKAQIPPSLGVEDNARHLVEFTDLALDSDDPTYILGHSWGSLPVLSAIENDTLCREICDNTNLQGIGLFAPFFAMHSKKRALGLPALTDIAGQIPGLKNTPISLSRNKIAGFVMKAIHGTNTLKEIELSDPDLRDLDRDFQRKFLTPAFMRQAGLAQKELYASLNRTPDRIKTTIILPEIEKFTCNDVAEEWAHKMGAGICHLPGARHSDLYDISSPASGALITALCEVGIPLSNTQP